MPKSLEVERDGLQQPPRKLRKISRAKPVEKKQKFRKRKNVTKNMPLNLCDLPTEILEKIIGNINIWHHNRIRGTCTRLKDINDVFLMHEFKKALVKHTSQNPNSETSAALRVIEKATEVYVRSGFESTFCGCILPMLRCSYRDPFCPHISQIKKFLTHFYDMVTELMGNITSQRWRLLYTITLFSLIKAFNKSIISSTNLPLHWRIMIELKGPWLGTLWTLKGRPLNQSRHHCNLLIILAEMLISSIKGSSFKNVWECRSEMYVFGNDTSNSNHLPVTLLVFTVYGSKKVCNLFRSCMENQTDEFQWPSKWPNDQFTVNLDIICKEAMKWGCSKSHHMELGPFSDTKYAEEENKQFLYGELPQ